MWTWLIAAVGTLLAAVAAPLGGAAQEATPTGSPSASLAAPSRPRCPARPTSPADLVAILREPTPEDPDAADPRGDAAPPTERATLGDLVATWTVCLTSSDVPALLGLFTPDGARRLLAERSPFIGGPCRRCRRVYVAGWGVLNARGRTGNDTSGVVFALDQRTGRERWRFLAAARFGAVAVGQGVVYGQSDRGLYAIDRVTGRMRWRARFSPEAGETTTVAARTVVFAGSEITSGKTGVFALDASTGARRWRVDLPAAPGARAGTAAANDAVFISWWDAPGDQPGSGTPTLRDYDLKTGQERWVFRVSASDSPGEPVGAGSLTAPVVDGQTVLFGVTVCAPAPDASGNADGLFAVDTATGEMRWQASAAVPIRSAPAVLDGTVYAMGGLRPRGGASWGNLLAFGAK